MMLNYEHLESRKFLAADFSVAINFQPIDARRAPGMLVDYGASYNVRRGGLSYGWTDDNSAAAVQNNRIDLSRTVRNDTFINVQSGQSWNIAVPKDGIYSVTIVSGDVTHPNERIGISAEGSLVIAGMTRGNKRFLETTSTVTVTDGNLTISGAGGLAANKINYIAISYVSGLSPSARGAQINWTTGASDPTPRVEPESAVVDGKLYVFSGYGDKRVTHGTGWQPSPTYERYDPATNQWTMLGRMPIATTHAACTVVGKDIWLAGGYTARPHTTSKQDIGSTNVWIYHTKTNTWDRGPSLPDKRASSGMAVIDNKIYYISGEPEDHHTNSKEVWMYDLNNKSAGWVPRADFPDPRTHFGTVVVNKKIYVIGGQYNIDARATFLKTNYMYDPAANHWRRLADLPTQQSHNSPNTIVINNQIYTFGGEFRFNRDVDHVYRYNPSTNKFDELTSLPEARAAGSA